MSGITSIPDSQDLLINANNSTQDPQKSTSLHGRAFHKVSEGAKYIIQSISQLAQSILSTCIRVVSFGRYNLDSLKSYLFTKQTPLEKAAKDNSSATPPSNPVLSSPPPPPKMPTKEDLNRASSMRLSSTSNHTFNANSRPITAQDPSLLEEESFELEDREDNSKPTIVSSQNKDSSNALEEESYNMEQKKKMAQVLVDGVAGSRLFQRIKGTLRK